VGTLAVGRLRKRRGLFSFVVNNLLGLVPVQEPTWVAKVESVHCESDHATIQDIEENLGRDDTAVPAVSKLNSTVD